MSKRCSVGECRRTAFQNGICRQHVIELQSATLADILGRFVKPPPGDPVGDRVRVTLPIANGTYDRWQAVLDEHGG